MVATLQAGEVQFPQIQAVLFDKDGTLADSAPFLKRVGRQRAAYLESWFPGIAAKILQRLGLEGEDLDPTGLLAVATRQQTLLAVVDCLLERGVSRSGAIDLAETAFIEADRTLPTKAELTPPLPGTIDLVHRLATAGIKLGVLSADTSQNVAAFLHCYGLDPYFTLAWGSDRGFSKPDPALLEQACNALVVLPATVLVVGDARTDISMAQAGGARSIGVTWGGTQPHHLVGADSIIQQCDQLQVLDKLQD